MSLTGGCFPCRTSCMLLKCGHHEWGSCMHLGLCSNHGNGRLTQQNSKTEGARAPNLTEHHASPECPIYTWERNKLLSRLSNCCFGCLITAPKSNLPQELITLVSNQSMWNWVKPHSQCQIKNQPGSTCKSVQLEMGYTFP